jgi:hypothetical protein
MRKLRAPLLILSAMALGSCSYIFPFDIVERDGKVLFWTERKWKWFLIPTRPSEPVPYVEVWSGERWMWRIKARPNTQILLPVTYGELPANAVQVTPPQPLARGTTYYVSVERNNDSFRLKADGSLQQGGSPWAPDPDMVAEQRRSDRRAADLMKTGMSRAAAERAAAEERRRGVRY